MSGIGVTSPELFAEKRIYEQVYGVMKTLKPRSSSIEQGPSKCFTQ